MENLPHKSLTITLNRDAIEQEIDKQSSYQVSKSSDDYERVRFKAGIDSEAIDLHWESALMSLREHYMSYLDEHMEEMVAEYNAEIADDEESADDEEVSEEEPDTNTYIYLTLPVTFPASLEPTLQKCSESFMVQYILLRWYTLVGNASDGKDVSTKAASVADAELTQTAELLDRTLIKRLKPHRRRLRPW